jgi:hypothetical protein
MIEAIKRLDAHYASIPAVAPDDELEDTIRRIHESNEFLPPFPGYGSRSEVRIEPEDPYADGFSLAAHAFVAMVAFGLGGIAGCLLMLV